MHRKIFLLIGSICWCCCAVIEFSGDCSFTIPDDESKKPKLYKKIGKFPIEADRSQYRINENEVITVECERHHGQAKSGIDVKCTGGYLFVDDIKLDTNPHFWCDPIKWSLYESSKQFEWCPMPMTSYLVARPLGNVYDYLAGICYKAERQQIVSILYAASYRLSKYKHPIRLEKFYPSEKILDIPTTFIPCRINATHFHNAETREWLKFAQYENHSLIQDPNLYGNVFDHFGGLLDVEWWPNLRSGNWHLYEQALRQHIEADKEIYDILAGVSGVVAVPSQENGSGENGTLAEITYEEKQNVPLYIWHYLKNFKNNGRDLVVIGVNSDFNFYKKGDLIFCADICHQIEWLETAEITFDYERMGLVFCCDANEVKLSKRLDGFPM